MPTIQKRLDSLQPYVISIRYVQGMNVVDAVFKEGWAVPKSDYLEIEKGSNDEEYYMFYSQKENIGIDELLDYVEHIISINIERELKYELLKEKVNELKTLFNQTSLDKLKSLKFKLFNNLVSENVLEEDILLNEAEQYEPQDKPQDKSQNKPQDKSQDKSQDKPQNKSKEKSKESSKEELPKEEFKDKRGNSAKVNHNEYVEEELKQINDIPKTKMFGNVELPSKNEKIKLEEFDPVQTECNCGPDEVCPVCADRKGY